MLLLSLPQYGHLFDIMLQKSIRQVASTLCVHIHLYYIKNKIFLLCTK